MPPVIVKKNEIHTGKKKTPLISGEVHYWRLNPSYWKEVLASVRSMGLDLVATYVPWDYHEYKRGHFDFTGKTDQTRNLKAFLELTRSEGFQLIIRPGPYIYSEWPNDGVPSYAHKYHRLHPKFKEYALNYLKKVTPVYKPYLATKRGGHIILVQADNEIDPWPDLFGHQYGLSGKPGMFQDFIREQYNDNLDELNDAWGTEYKSFDEAGPFIATMLAGEQGLPLKGDRELKRNLDYFKFKYHYAKQVADWNRKAFRDLGIDVPVYLNVYPFFYAHDWAELQESADLIGVDLYPSSELAEDAYEPRKFTDKVRYLKTVSKLPYIAEFASGVWHGRHYESGLMTPNHYRVITLSALLGGIAGWNWYMLVNRDNWYMSPINEWGRTRPELFEVFKQLVGIYRAMHPPTLTKLSEIAATFNPLQYAARTLPHDNPTLMALHRADIDYEFYNPKDPRCEQPFLFYSGNQWLEGASQQHLRDYIESGGTLIAFRDFPRKDSNFRKLNLVGFEEPTSILFEFKRQFEIHLAPDRPKVPVTSSVYTFKPSGKVKAISAHLGNYGKHTIGYIKNIGKGRLVHVGVHPTRELVLEILGFLKAGLVCHSTSGDMQTALFQRGKSYFLVVVNNGEEDKSASIYLPALDKFRGSLRIRNVESGRAEIYSAERRRPFATDIPRKDGKVFELRPINKA